MVKQVPVSFKNHRGLTLRGVVHVPQHYEKAVVWLHGFPGDMDGTAKRFCTALSRNGYVCLRFDFSGSNTSDGKYEDKLMSEEVKDVRAAVNFIKKHYPTKKLVLAGISTGAIDAALYAHTDRRVSGLVLAGGVSYLDQAARYDFTDRQVREFWLKGYTHHPPLGKLRRGSWIPNKGKLKKAFYDEFFTLDIPKAIKQYRKPLLVLHGEKDEAIPSAKDPHELYALAHKPKQLVIIKGGDHRLRKQFRPALAALLRFIRRV